MCIFQLPERVALRHGSFLCLRSAFIPEPRGGIFMLEKYDTANKEGQFGQGYQQNLLLHFILMHWMVSGTVLLGACFNHELHLNNEEFQRRAQLNPRKWDTFLHEGSVFLLENTEWWCQVRNALGRLWGDGSFMDFSSPESIAQIPGTSHSLQSSAGWRLKKHSYPSREHGPK